MVWIYSFYKEQEYSRTRFDHFTKRSELNGELGLVILQITPTRFRYLQVVDDFSGFVKRLAIFLPTLANFYAAGQVFIVVNDKY